MKDTVVFIGNDIRADDGLPFLLADLIAPRLSGIEMIKTSEAGIQFADLVAESDKAVLVDTVLNTELAPGTLLYHRVEPEEGGSEQVATHNLGILSALELYRELKAGAPRELHLLLICIRENGIFSEELSGVFPGLEDRLAKILIRILSPSDSLFTSVDQEIILHGGNMSWQCM